MKSKKSKDKRTTSDLTGLFLDNYPSNSRFAEAFRTLRTNVQFSFIENDFHSLLITSSAQGEGKTSTVANFAYSMAKTGKTVLMIDADLRKPFLSRLVTSHSSQGLSGILSSVFATEVGKGAIADFSVSDLYRLITMQKKTGVLHLSEGAEKIDLIFQQGILSDLEFPTRPEEKKLASLLIKNEMLKSEYIKQAVNRQKVTGQKLGFTLINMGLLKREEVEGLLNIQMMDGLRTALQFKTGEFHFEELGRSEFKIASFDPVDFQKLYNQLVIGEEDLRYINGKIDASILKTSAENLSLLPSGALPPNPSELLGSERTSFLLSLLKKRFDLLVIDSPPILPASDALMLAPQTDGVVFMTKAGHINRDMVRKALDALNVAKANVVGIVLNQVDTKRGGYYYYRYYHKYYSKYYGEAA